VNKKIISIILAVIVIAGISGVIVYQTMGNNNTTANPSPTPMATASSTPTQATTSPTQTPTKIPNVVITQTPIPSGNIVYVNYTSKQVHHGENAGYGWSDIDGIAVWLYISSNYDVTIDLSKFCLQHENQPYITSEDYQNSDNDSNKILVTAGINPPWGPLFYQFIASGSPFDYQLVYNDPTVTVHFTNKTT
jgi:hypothetical protein